MIRLKINNQQVEVEQGATILDAATAAGVRVPTMCFLKGYDPSISCMVCVVEVKGTANLVPSCGAVAMDGMEVITDSERVTVARKRAIELLLSDHVGDCVGPCQVACPAKMDIPLMIKQIAGGRFDHAIQTVKKDIALPAILGRICPAPCEKVCRRDGYDQAVSICLLKRYVADVDLASENTYVPPCQPLNGKKAAIVGAGPAGLSAAYYLRQVGIDCTIYDDHKHPGGALRYEDIDRSLLPIDLVDQEIAQLLSIGIHFKGNVCVGSDILMSELKCQYDAILVANGKSGSNPMDCFGAEVNADIIQVNRQTYASSEKGIFFAGGCIGSRELCVRAVADGKEAATAVNQYLSGQQVSGVVKRFNSRMGKCDPDELEIFVRHANEQTRLLPEYKGQGLTPMQVLAESKRCLHCQCRKPDDCKLRELAEEFGAKASQYKSKRRTFKQYCEHADIMYEPGKCIDCGLCVQVAKEHDEELGLIFTGRGFDVRPAIPFNETMKDALKKTAKKCVDVCPTGALAMKE